MAVNLRAVATLNNKPFLKSLAQMSAAAKNLNKGVLGGTSLKNDPILAQTLAREKASTQAGKAAQAMGRGMAANSKAVNLAGNDLKNYNKILQQTYASQGKAIEKMAGMTAAQRAQSGAVQNFMRAADAHAMQAASGLQGPALTKYQDSIDKAARSVASSNDRVNRENNKLADSTGRATSALNAKNAAMQKGITGAQRYSKSLTGMTSEQLRMSAAGERLAAQQARLASALAAGNAGSIASARAGVLGATDSYNKLADAQNKVGRATAGAANGLAAQRYLFQDLSRQAAMAAIGIAVIPVAAIATAAVWENKFANVIRTSDPVLMNSTKRIEALRTSLVDMAKTMPLGFGNITEIATLGNQMGVSADELESFTRAVGMFSATSGIAVEEAATAFGRLRTVASDANFSYMGVADSILKVGVNSVATEQEIINVTTQISSIAASAGFSTKEMIGLSGALASVRVPPELSRSIITRTFGQFDKAVQKNGTELQTLARVSGRSVEDIRKNWGKEGAADIFTDFIGGIRRAGGQARTELNALGITSVRDIPALMRLANAADSEGVKGGLLTQTITDAKTAAGTVQKQYAIMSQTVAGRLKVLGNNVLATFDSMGKGSNEFIKDMIDGITKLVQITGDIVDNPFSGYALGAMGAVAALGLMLSATAKVTAGVKSVQHAMALAKGSTFFAAIGGTGKAGGAGALAALSPMMAATAVGINNMKSGLVAAGGAWRNFGGAITVAAGSAVGAMGNTVKSTSMMSSGMKNLYAPTAQATGALGSLVKYGLHPVTIGLAAVATIGTMVYTNWAKSFYKATTSTQELAKSLSNIDMNNTGDLSNVLKSINISGQDMGRWASKGITPFAGGMPGMIKDLRSYVEYLDKAGEATATYSLGDLFGGSKSSSTLLGLEKSSGLDLAALANGYKNLDAAFKDMREAGNEAQVLSFWKQIGKGADTATERTKLFKTLQKEMPEEFKAIEKSAALAGVSTSSYMKNLNKYAGEALDTMMGFEGTSVIADAFNLDPEEAVSYGKALNEAASAFINFGAAVEAGTVTDDDGVFQGFNLDKFDASLRTSIDEQNKWMDNLKYLSTYTNGEGAKAFDISADIIAEAGAMGPAGKHMIQEWVNGLSSGDPEIKARAEESVRLFGESVAASKIDFGPNLAEYTNVTNQAKAMGVEFSNVFAASLTPDDWSILNRTITDIEDKFGDAGKNLNKKLLSGLNDGSISWDTFNTLTDTFSQVGYRASRNLMKALEEGVSLDQVLARATRLQDPRIKVDLEANPGAADKVAASLRSLFKNPANEINVPLKLDSMTVNDLRRELDDNFLPEVLIDGDMDLSTALETYGSFREYLLSMGIDVEMLVHPGLAYVEVDSFVSYADNQEAMVMIDALTDPGEGKLWQFVTLADGTVVVAKVDAETGLATGKMQQLDTSGEEPVWKTVDARTDQAQAAIEEINTKAKEKQTKSINVTDNGTAAGVQSSINAIRGRTVYVTVNERAGTKVPSAQGNIFEAYAKGGVREDHRPQIAPAGAMRLWAEPETGGEAYIPFAMDRRKRAEGILNTVADRFGYSLVRGNNVSQYANGGMYELQSRSRYDRMRNDRVNTPETQKVVNFKFVNPVVRDPFEDAWDKAQEIGALV